MKLPILFLCLFVTFAPAFAEEDIQVVERKTCEQIKQDIATLNAIESPSAEEQADLKQLIMQQRANCGAKSAGRRTVLRTQVPAQDTVAPVVGDALTEYMNAKRSNCDKLNAEIAKASDDIVAEMQRVYDMDCATPKEPETAVAEVAEVGPIKTDEEIAAEFDANIAAEREGAG